METNILIILLILTLILAMLAVKCYTLSCKIYEVRDKHNRLYQELLYVALTHNQLAKQHVELEWKCNPKLTDEEYENALSACDASVNNLKENIETLNKHIVN